jgi:hypothetical protein
MDLFTPIVPEDAWHPNFAAQIRRPNPWNRAVLDDWATGFVDRDGKFVHEFQTTFNSCFWELYLNAVLRERGRSVDFNFQSPDFVITGREPFIVEAAIASHAKGALPEYRRAEAKLPDDLNELNRQAIIRLSNALHGKYENYKTHYATLPHVARKPFVVALSPFDRPNFNMSCQRAIEALLYNYYVDEEKWIAAGVQEVPAPKGLLFSVKKETGTDIELGVFQNGAMPEVSAVIFSTCATWGKVRALSTDPNPNIFFTALLLNPTGPRPHCIRAKKSEYKETLLDGLRVYHNPDASHPLDPAIFRNPGVMQSYYSQDAEDWEHEQRDGQLLFRSVFSQESEG